MKYLTFSVFLLLGCQTTKQAVVTEPQPPTSPTVAPILAQTGQDESFDPAVLGDTWEIRPKRKSGEGLQPWTEAADSLPSGESSISNIGFRVQLVSTTEYYEALMVRDTASVRMRDEIYLDYEPPYYKVRVGNFDTREKAEISRTEAKKAGYHDAWIVRTRINLKK